MQVTSYNVQLPDGSIEVDVTGSPVVYSMGGHADERVPDNAVNVSTKDAGMDTITDASQYYAQAEAAADAWAAMLANGSSVG